MKKRYWDGVAKKYFENIMSPFREGVKNPLYDYIDKLEGKDKTLIDIGTGIGNAIPHLAGRFAHVTAIDISDKMIEVAKGKHKFDNVEFLVRNAAALQEFYGQFDVAVAVNSIIVPTIKDLEKILKETCKVLKDGGRLLAVFPSMEAILYQAMLVYEAVLEETGSEKTARLRTARELGAKKFDLLMGIDKEGFAQKYFYRFEIKYRLRKAGFKNIRVRKVHYPWEISAESGYAPFHGKPRMWDWFVVAEK